MEKKGQTVMLSILFALVIFVFGMLFLNYLKSDFTTARTALDCTNVSITDGTKTTCLLVDTSVPYWILLVISISGGIILDRLLV